MNKKVELGIVGLLIIVFLGIALFAKQRSNTSEISPVDVVEDFFKLMYEGNFEDAMDCYLYPYKQNQLDALKKQEEFYREHWKKYGINIESQNINAADKTATVEVTIHKYDSAEIFSDVTVKMLNINPLKADGTYITEDELKTIKNELIKQSFEDGNKHGIITNKYTLDLIVDDEYDSWYIINDEQISDILFGNISDDKK